MRCSSLTARIMVQAMGNIFFAVSPANFSIVAPAPVPVLQPLRFSNGVAQLAWSAVAGQRYRVQYKPSLGATAWTDLGPDITVAGATVSVTDAAGSARQRYYRVLVLP